MSTRFALGDSDAYWQLATARDALQRGLGQPDIFSWTATGRPVATDQWLGQLLLFGSYLAGGWMGVGALRALAVGALAALTVLLALDARPGRPLLAVLVALPALFLERFISAERPELLGFVCFAALVLLLRRGQAGSDRALVACVPLIVVWANLHGSFALAVALLLVVCLAIAIAEPARRRVAIAVGLAGVAASLATPAGLAAWSAPGLHFTSPPRFIQEWSVVEIRSLPGALFALAFAVTVVVALADRHPARREAVLLVPLLFLSLTAQRQLPYFVIAAVPYLAARLPWPWPTASPSTAGARAVPAVAAAVALALLAGGVLTGPREPDLRGYPVDALARLPAGPGVLAQYDWGGYLIFAAHGTPTFVDGRLVPYLGTPLADYATIVAARPGWRDVIARRGVRALLLRPSDPAAVRATDLGWLVRARSGDFVLIEVPY